VDLKECRKRDRRGGMLAFEYVNKLIMNVDMGV